MSQVLSRVQILPLSAGRRDVPTANVLQATRFHPRLQPSDARNIFNDILHTFVELKSDTWKADSRFRSGWTRLAQTSSLCPPPPRRTLFRLRQLLQPTQMMQPDPLCQQRSAGGVNASQPPRPPGDERKMPLAILRRRPLAIAADRRRLMPVS